MVPPFVWWLPFNTASSQGGGPARACPVAAPTTVRACNSVRTSTVWPVPCAQAVTLASCRAATAAAIAHGSPPVSPRAASAAARAARSAADAALDAITADCASSSTRAIAVITTRPRAAARTVPEPRSWRDSGCTAGLSPGRCLGRQRPRDQGTHWPSAPA